MARTTVNDQNQHFCRFPKLNLAFHIRNLQKWVLVCSGMIKLNHRHQGLDIREGFIY